jgi:hypothetical protein
MNAKTWLGGLVSAMVGLVPSAGLVGLSSVGPAGCGQDVATCGDICALPDAPADCVTGCNLSQATAASSGRGPDFQAYLTCVANAQTYAAVDGLCADAARTVNVSTTLGGGDTPADASVTSEDCAAATCASVCAGETAETSCATDCTNSQNTCVAFSAEFQALLSCLCEGGNIAGINKSDASATTCVTQIALIDEVCPGVSMMQP